MRSFIFVLFGVVLFSVSCKSLSTRSFLPDNRDRIERIGELNARNEITIGTLEDRNSASITEIESVQTRLFGITEQLQRIDAIIQTVKARGRYYYNQVTGRTERLPD
jgi:hypothetical protein